MNVRPILLDAARKAAGDYLENVADRRVGASADGDTLRDQLRVPLSDGGEPAGEVLAALVRAGEIGTIATQGPRYFGFVTGGSLPVATAADWMVSAWDQNGALHVMSPLSAVVEEVVADWVRMLLVGGGDWSVGFVTGGHMANFTAMAAARRYVLLQRGWDVEKDGLAGAPPVTVLAGEEAHYTIATAVRLLGLGSERIVRIPADDQGRMDAQALRRRLQTVNGPSIVCAQAGNVNSGAFDPIEALADICREQGAWLHVDGAFGLWAAASPSLKPLVAGIERADSLATDAHKWLNVPYDCGLVLCAHAGAHRGAMTVAASYIETTLSERDARAYVPEESRRARGIPVYAVLRTLGTHGLANMIDTCCRHARRFAEGLADAGYEILNDVVLNQVLVAFGDDDTTRRVIRGVQADGTCWCGGTQWRGRAAMRISVASWATTEADVERCLHAITAVARQVRGQ